MDGIVFAEGLNDLTFIHESFTREGFDFYVDEFNVENIHDSDPLQRESVVIRRFPTAVTGDSLLLKSEQGINQLVDVVSALMGNIAEKDAFFTIVMDLDGGSLEDLICEIERKTRDNWGDEMQINLVDGLHSNSDFLRGRYEIRTGSEYLDTFGVIGFLDDLERVAGIDDTDSRTEKDEKIRRYLDQYPSRSSDFVATAI